MDRITELENALRPLSGSERAAALKELPVETHAALAARQRERLKGKHQSETKPGAESREIGLEQVSQTAAIRAIIRVKRPDLKPDSPAFMREVQATLAANANAPSAKKRL